ncbi:hypothetical protein [Vibrio parahaemolyticus]|uniref:hypothetical protein n=1 Tax=Vibrio parahaemolyticus TaxID=670 RepID=UPI001B82A897|nr:hypothetical protein [Vibrio parahaemolyticus]EIZ9928852.1 hypothetical protein [Vibrio parahaemolyticus]MDF5075089.1 hypothetical protein [Vibrio parahaemolyticus]MDF5411786.1 hypothetical protein [Vibrio parahaemolyticus]MDF5422047.1 hypothetical protein [Vibrio parahaemolyticus]HBC3860363.1 hypothetical protein [Vibrio parahaemolyticus]
MNSKLKTVHRTCAILAFLTIASFFSSTLISEVFASTQTIAVVKQVIAYTVWGLIPLMAITGATGAKLAPKVKMGVGPIGRKKKRMPIIAINGLVILLPAALYLNTLASQGDFGTNFYIVQVFELLAGATNLTLMGLSLRDVLSKQTR